METTVEANFPTVVRAGLRHGEWAAEAAQKISSGLISTATDVPADADTCAALVAEIATTTSTASATLTLVSQSAVTVTIALDY